MKEALLDYLKVKSIKHIDKGHKILTQCINPLHSDKSPSAFFNIEKQFFHCSSCGYHLNSEGLNKLLDIDIPPSEIKKLRFRQDRKKVKEIETPKQIFLPAKKSDFIKDYRGISKDTFSKVEAYFSEYDHFYGRRIIFLLRDYANKLIGFEAVSTSKLYYLEGGNGVVAWGIKKSLEGLVGKLIEQPKVLRNKGFDATKYFGFENLVRDKETLFITEGVFSALSILELGYNAVFNFGIGSIQDKLDIIKLKQIKKVILCGDNDEAGRKFNKESAKILREHKIKYGFWRYKPKYPNKFDANDILKISREELLEAIDYNIKFN